MKDMDARRGSIRELTVIGVLALACVLLPCGCKRRSIELNQWPCNARLPCASGYVCRIDGKCVHLLTPACDTGGICPSTTEIGAACRPAGALMPCRDDLTECDGGCRVCSEQTGWSTCLPEMCVLGRAQSCDTCDDKCTDGGRIQHAEPVCVPSLEDNHYRCGYRACLDGAVDADANVENGCECVPQPEECDGLDSDCDGVIDNGENHDGCKSYYADTDGDGVGSGAAKCLCVATSEFSATVAGDDCEGDAATCAPVYVAGPEVYAGIAGCATDHETNSDAAGEGSHPVPDCVERFCGSDPRLAASRCLLVSSCDDPLLNNLAVSSLAYPLHVLLGDIACTGPFPDVAGASDGVTTIRQRPGTKITLASTENHAALFTLVGSNIRLDGLEIIDNRTDDATGFTAMVRITGDNNAVLRSHMVGYLHRGIELVGTRASTDGCTTKVSGTWLVGNRLVGDRAGDDSSGNAALYLSCATNTRIVGNLIEATEVDGIQLLRASDTFIDHNSGISYDDDSGTVNGMVQAYPMGGASSTAGETSEGVCLRNNLIVGLSTSSRTKWEAALQPQNQASGLIATANTTALCVGPVTSTTTMVFGNAVDPQTVPCSACASPSWPDGLFTSLVALPTYASDPAGYYCLARPSSASDPTNSPLFDQGYDLGYNFARLDDPDAVLFPAQELWNGSTTANGRRVTLGARQPGLGGCP